MWHYVHQVHGRTVVTPQPGVLVDADAMVSSDRGVGLAVLGADCGLLGLSSPEGVIAAVHAGWRGLVAGVIPAAVTEMRARGASDITAVLGPCIHPECYEFSPGDLDFVADKFGDSVRAVTSSGAPALDLPAGISLALEQNGVEIVAELGGCSACGPLGFSHRARKETDRLALGIYRKTDAASS